MNPKVNHLTDLEEFYSDFVVEAETNSRYIEGFIYRRELEFQENYGVFTVFRCQEQLAEGVELLINNRTYTVKAALRLESSEYQHVLKNAQ